MEESKDKDP